jgi:hypothetical protein
VNNQLVGVTDTYWGNTRLVCVRDFGVIPLLNHDRILSNSFQFIHLSSIHSMLYNVATESVLKQAINKSGRIAGVPVDIRTEHLLKACL